MNNSAGAIYDVVFLNNWGGVKREGTTRIVNIRKCVFRNNSKSAQFGGGAELRDIDGSIIDSNIFISNYAPGGAGALAIHNSNNVTIRANTFIRNHSSIYGGAVALISPPCSNINIANNTFFGNYLSSPGGSYGGSSIFVYGSSSSPIKNNIFYYADDYSILGAESNNISVDYNSFYNSWPEAIYGVNMGYGNIYDSPLFNDTLNLDFRLRANSPCIDTGDPASPYDPDGTRADMGALYFDQRYRILDFDLITPQTNLIHLIQPNPFMWRSTADIDSGFQVLYRFYWDDNMQFSSPDSSGVISDTAFTLPNNLNRSHWYYWRVLAFNYHATPIYSNETWSFYIDGYPSLPEITGPSDGASADVNTFLSWTAGEDPDAMDTVTYSLQVDNSPAFGSPEINVSGITNEGTINDQAVAIRLSDLPGHQNLQNGQVYYWRVRADDKFGLNSGFTSGSNYFSFGVNVNDPPNAPILGFSPANAQEISTNMPVISWNNATDPDPDDNASTLSYRVQIDNDGEFINSFRYQYLTAQGTNQIQVDSALTDNTHWYYRIQTIDDGGLTSPWSAIQNFWVRLYNLSPYPPDGAFAPASDIEISNPLPIISWLHAFDPDVQDDSSTLRYVIQLDSDGEFDLSVAYELSTPVGQNHIQIVDSLSEDAHWSYRIKTLDDGGLSSAWSQIQSFWLNYNNRPPNAPAGGFNPSGEQVVATPHPEIYWSLSTDPDPSDNPSTISYTLQLDADGEFDTSITFTYLVPSGVNHFLVPDSLFDSRWFWRIRAIDDEGANSPWSPIQHFIVNYLNSPPNSPISGFSPANGEEIISLTPIITWNSASDPDPEDDADVLSYVARLSLDSLFGGFVFYDTTGLGFNQIQIPFQLFDNSRYFYQVKTLDDGGLSSDWSTVQNFWTNHYNFPPEPFPLFGPPDGAKQVDYYTQFSWGSTVDYDPNSSFTYSIQASPDTFFNLIYRMGTGLTDTTFAIATDSIGIIGPLYWRILATDDDSLVRIGGMPEGPKNLMVLPAGDANANGVTNGLDVTFLVNYFKGYGPAPDPILAGDANGSCVTNGIDVTYLVNYLKGLGGAPVRGNCETQILGDINFNPDGGAK